MGISLSSALKLGMARRFTFLSQCLESVSIRGPLSPSGLSLDPSGKVPTYGTSAGPRHGRVFCLFGFRLRIVQEVWATRLRLEELLQGRMHVVDRCVLVCRCQGPQDLRPELCELHLKKTLAKSSPPCLHSVTPARCFRQSSHSTPKDYCTSKVRSTRAMRTTQAFTACHGSMKARTRGDQEKEEGNCNKRSQSPKASPIPSPQPQGPEVSFLQPCYALRFT